jgi:GntR family transcriptional repressor for pyruvate dehydrogenase complex
MPRAGATRRHVDMMRLVLGAIVSGAYPPGERFPREADLAEEYEVSRGVAREAFRGLEERGLITVTHGARAIVNDSTRWRRFDPDVLAAMLEGEHRAEVLAEYLACRRIMEVEGAGLAAEHRTAEDIARMRAALSRMEDAARLPTSSAAEDRFHSADIQFHEALIGATGNHALGELVATIREGLLTARYPLARPQYRTERALPEHREILRAIETGDPNKARRAMRNHLDTIAGYLHEYVASDAA